MAPGSVSDVRIRFTFSKKSKRIISPAKEHNLQPHPRYLRPLVGCEIRKASIFLQCLSDLGNASQPQEIPFIPDHSYCLRLRPAGVFLVNRRPDFPSVG